MGKIRVKTFGDEETEQEEKKKQQQRKDAKKMALVKKDEPEIKPVESVTENPIPKEIPQELKEEVKVKKEKKFEDKAFHSKAYQTLSDIVDKSKIYTLNEGLELLTKLQRNKFDETVELHLNTVSSGVSGNVTLPHGTGKKTKVSIATDELIAEIEKGKIEFDILLAEPTMMAKLAKVAKVLGPKGLMPNPKNGTITTNPQEALKKYEGGQVNFKTEAKSPLMHLTVGKMSFGKEKLVQNIESLITAVKKSNIVNATLKSTMSPGIKIKI
jgi:large subunit ribosomal protein L1